MFITIVLHTGYIFTIIQYYMLIHSFQDHGHCHLIISLPLLIVHLKL